MKKESKEIATQEQKAIVQSQFDELLLKGIVEKSDLDKLEKLLQMRREERKDQARMAYHAAMAEFKANAPDIKKDKKVSYSAGGGKVGYNHASLFNVTKTISKELSKHGLSASWTTKQNGQILVTCKITHELGHSEETTLSAPSDTTGSKNAIQAIGSTITYLERYTLLALTGLATYDQDDDAQQVGVEYIDDKEKNQILDLLIAKDIKEKKFLEYMKVENLDLIPKSQYKKAIAALEGAKKK